MKIIAALAVAATASAALAQFQTIDFSSQFNMAHDNAYLANGHTFPTGNQTFLGVPFALGGSGDTSTPWAWNALFGQEDSSQQSLSVATNVNGAVAVHTLINTFWGMPGSEGSFLSITFNATGGLSHTVDLYGDSDVRDYNQNNWTNSINGTTTQNVFDNGFGQRMDMQTFVLPAAFANETLTSVVLTDRGGYAFQTAFISGLTVQTPTPGAAAVLGLGGLGAMRRRRR
ncbi:MAG: VPLPA-CTERM sorting domain-containing protein [Phycisphaerales bacterium]